MGYLVGKVRDLEVTIINRSYIPSLRWFSFFIMFWLFAMISVDPGKRPYQSLDAVSFSSIQGIDPGEKENLAEKANWR